MGDKEDGLSLCRQILHNLQQLLNFLRGQHGGRLVKNQNLIVPVEHFEDLGTLLHTNGNILYQCIRIDLQAVLPGQGHDLLPGLFPLQKAVFGVFHAQNNVVQNGEAFYQLKVLMHHADAQGVGIVGVVDRHFHAVFADHALLCLIQAKEDTHERRFSRAVFAQQRVNFSFSQLERHIVIGNDSGKPFGDVHHLDCVRCLLQSNYLLLRSHRRHENSADLCKTIYTFVLYTIVTEISNRILSKLQLF